MVALCKMFCPEDLRRETETFKERTAAKQDVGTASAVAEANSNASPGSNDEKEEDERSDEFKGYDVI